MGVVLTRRQRLTSSAVVVAAIAVAALLWPSNEAQAQRDPAVNCAPYGTALPRTIRDRAVTTGEAASVTQSLARIAAYEADPRRVTIAEVETAGNACADHLGGRNSFNLPAYSCVARAGAIVAAAQNTMPSHEAASCKFDNLARIASAGRATTYVGAAYEGRANELMAVRRLEGPSRAVRLQSEALTAFQAAIDSGGENADRQRRLFSRGRAYMEFAAGDNANRQNYINAALADINAGAALGMTDEAALTLVELSQSPGVDATAVLAPLSNRNTLAVQTALGSAYYNRYAAALKTQPVDAARYLQAARGPLANAVSLAGQASTAAPAPGLPDFRAEAFHYAALLDAADGSWGSAYDRARRATGSDARFKQLTCLSMIARGWPRTENETAVTQCDVAGDASANLIRGMYHLRRAQYINPGEIDPRSPVRQAYMREMRAAVDAFNIGIGQVSASVEPDQVVTLPSYPEGVNLRHALEFGRSIVAPTCSGPREQGLAINPVPDDVRASGMPLYRRYNLHLCEQRQEPR